jgi:hypothetical protein
LIYHIIIIIRMKSNADYSQVTDETPGEENEYYDEPYYSEEERQGRENNELRRNQHVVLDEHQTRPVKEVTHVKMTKNENYDKILDKLGGFGNF